MNTKLNDAILLFAVIGIYICFNIAFSIFPTSYEIYINSISYIVVIFLFKILKDLESSKSQFKNIFPMLEEMMIGHLVFFIVMFLCYTGIPMKGIFFGMNVFIFIICTPFLLKGFLYIKNILDKW